MNWRVVSTPNLIFILVLGIFFPAPAYRVLAPLLGPFSLFVLLFSIGNILNSYLLSIGKTGVYKINLLAAAILIGLIILFHESIFQIIGALFAATLLLLVFLLIYYWKNGRD